jgi:hypothetical protein
MLGAVHVIVTTLHTCPILCGEIEGEKRNSSKACVLLNVWSYV